MTGGDDVGDGDDDVGIVMFMTQSLYCAEVLWKPKMGV